MNCAKISQAQENQKENAASNATANLSCAKTLQVQFNVTFVRHNRQSTCHLEEKYMDAKGLIIPRSSTELNELKKDWPKEPRKSVSVCSLA
jgi:hypothetical protein